MKSKRAEEFINNRSELIDGLEWMVDASTARRAVELAEQDAEEEVNYYRKELEESKRREELARKVIDDQRKEIEALKARTVEVFKRCCIYRSKSEDSDSCFLNDQYNTCDNNCSKVKLFIQKLNKR